MTAIAASRDPNALALFRSILLASASIPAAFPPVMLDVTVDGTHYQEMHVDGGTMAQVFFYPPSADLSQLRGVERRRVLYVIRNARLDPDWASVERRTMTIATRAIASLTRTQGIGDLYRIYATTQRDGFDFNLAFIPPTFDTPHEEEFDTNYMQQLYRVGFDQARAGYSWAKVPPGSRPGDTDRARARTVGSDQPPGDQLRDRLARGHRAELAAGVVDVEPCAVASDRPRITENLPVGLAFGDERERVALARGERRAKGGVGERRRSASRFRIRPGHLQRQRLVRRQVAVGRSRGGARRSPRPRRTRWCTARRRCRLAHRVPVGAVGPVGVGREVAEAVARAAPRGSRPAAGYR
jgi:hypothetical protein